MSDAQKARERALEEAVSRAVRDNLPPLQRNLEELQQAFADLVAACSSARPTNALPAMLRVQSTSASLSASLSVLSSFIASIMQRRERELAAEESAEYVRAVGVTLPPPEPAETRPSPAIPTPMAEEEAPAPEASAAPAAAVEPGVPATAHEGLGEEEPEAALEAEPEPEAFEISKLPASEQELHKRANRVAKVSMQDIKMLKPEDVRKGRENKDLCTRLRADLDKARKEYDRRFHKILDHPVDYFHKWMVEILADGDAEALGEYPYPSPVLRR